MEMYMPKANEVLDSNVVVQIVEAPKAEYVVSVSEAQQIDNIVEKFIEADELLFEGDSLMQITAKALAKVLGSAPTYAQWNTVKQMWARKYMGRVPQANEESTQKQWERLAKRMAKEVGLAKPSAPSKAAVAVSEKRAKQKAELEAMPDSLLSDRLAAYKAVDNFTEANKVKAEIKRRQADANKGIEVEVKNARECVIKQIKLCSDIELLNQISEMLPSLPIAKM
jgi:hypothetical protein